MLALAVGELLRHLDEGVVAGLAALLEGLGPFLARLGFQDVRVAVRERLGKPEISRRGPRRHSQS